MTPAPGSTPPSIGSGSSYVDFYGDENPWVKWLQRHAPNCLSMTPHQLMRYMGAYR